MSTSAVGRRAQRLGAADSAQIPGGRTRQSRYALNSCVYNISMKSRIEKLQNQIKSHKASALLVTNPYNIFYLTGFIGLSPEERESALLVKQKEAFLFIPRMYEEQVYTSLRTAFDAGSNLKKQREIAALPTTPRNDDYIHTVIVSERHELLSRFADHLSPSDTLLFEANNLRVSEFNEIKKLHDNLKESDGLVESMRCIKDAEEIKKITKAVDLTDTVFQMIVTWLKNTDYTKLTELDVADKIYQYGRQVHAGGVLMGFEPIVACGAGSSFPHHLTSNRKLESSNLLLIDMGIKYQGYTGDLTRCVYLGKAPEETKKMYEIVFEANRRAIKNCRAGITCERLYLDTIADFKKHHLDSYFIHGLGHGVGLEIHEHPHLRKGITDILQKNMAVTIEPGLYFPNKYGIRIEDFVIVKANGCEVLSEPATSTIMEI